LTEQLHSSIHVRHIKKRHRFLKKNDTSGNARKKDGDREKVSSRKKHPSKEKKKKNTRREKKKSAEG